MLCMDPKVEERRSGQATALAASETPCCLTGLGIAWSQDVIRCYICGGSLLCSS